MSDTRVKDIQSVVLGNLAELMNRENRITEVSFKEDNGLYDTIITEHIDLGANEDSVIGEYAFLPGFDEDEGVAFFSITLTLKDDLTEETRQRVFKVLNKVNTAVTKGTFVVDYIGETLYYRDLISYPNQMEAQELYGFLCIQIAWALRMVNLWIAPLLYVENGEMTEKDFDEFLNSLKNR